MNELNKNINQFQEKDELKKREVEEYKNELKQSRKKLNDFIIELEKLQKESKLKEKSFNEKDIENVEQLKNLKNENSALHTTISSIKTEHVNVLEDKNNEITKLKAQISEYNIKEKEFRNLSAKKEAEIEDLKYQLLLLKEKNKLKEKIEQSKDEDNKKKQNDLEKLIKEKDEEFQKLKEIIEKLKKEIDFLKDI